MFLRRLSCLALVLIFSSFAKADDSPWSFSGTVTNTTDPKHSIQAAAVVSFNDKECLIRISPPLVGSGVCRIESLDKDKGTFVLKSEGPAGNITLNGLANGDDYSGSYLVDYPNYKDIQQKGVFQFHMDAKAIALKFGDVLGNLEFDKDGKHYNALREQNTVYIYDKDFNYQNIRLILDAKDNPTIRIEDHQDGAQYIDVNSNKVLMIWHCDGYVSGTSTLGSMSGNTQQLGNFTYGNYSTPSGQWSSTTQKIGNIEYHTMTAPDGTMHTGTSQHIGDFVYTNIQ